MKRKVVALVCAILVLMTALVPVVASAAIYHGYVKTGNYGPLNLRADITANSPIIGKIPYGKQVTILDYYNNNSWMGVEYNGKQGYVMARYIVFDEPSPAPQPGPAPQPVPVPSDLSRMFDGFQFTNYQAAVNPATPGGFVHMRWAPSKQMGIMTDYYDNQQLEVLAQNNTWCQVRDNETGRTGFMMRSFLRAIGYGYTGDGAALGDSAEN